MRSGLIMLGTLFLSVSALAGKTIQIADHGKARADIVIAQDASAADRHAAAELAEFLKEVTGGVFSVVNQSNAQLVNIYVGPEAAKLAEPNFSTTGLGQDGIVIKTVDNSLILAGGEPRGTLYAVYTFLEDTVGCRWWTPQASFIPKNPDLGIVNLDQRYVPIFEHRDPMIEPITGDPDWSVRNKTVGEMAGIHNLNIMPERGGCRKSDPVAHSYFSVLPPEKYFPLHPDWYSLIDGKRVASPSTHASLCLTNEQMQQEFAKNLIQRIRQAPSEYPSLYVKGQANPLMFVSVTPEDDSGPPDRCQCDRCSAIEKIEGSPAGLTLRFANQMAEAIKPVFPDKTVTMFAYHYTQKPPSITRPDANVIVYFCPIHMSYARPISDERNKIFQDDLLGWLKISNRIYIYDYPDNVTYELQPHPNLHVLADNIKFYAEKGVTGYFGDGMNHTTGGTELAPLRAWMLAKLLWNPSLDPDQLINEFTDGYYGAAGKPIAAYIRLMEHAAGASGDWLGLSDKPDAHFLSAETLIDGWSHLKAAEQAVQGDPVLTSRVKIAQLPELFVFLARWNELIDTASCRGLQWPLSHSRNETLNEFMQIAHSNGVTPSDSTIAELAKNGG